MLRIRLTEKERYYLDKSAKRRGLETSTWARMELLSLGETRPHRVVAKDHS